MDELHSPLTGEGPVTFLYSIDSEKLIYDYAEIFDIDIRKYLKGISTVNVFKCDRTGYRYYYPFDLCGDSEFYSKLEKYDWYYMDTKWEHEEALKNINPGDRVLEIGAARGSFLQRAIGIDKVSCVGIELNKSAAITAKGKGINVIVETAQEHAVNHENEYDVICLFQVLEHTSNPSSLLRATMKMLKRGGRLIIAVPDNSIRAKSSIFVSGDNILNMPPHHSGLWDIVSLSSLTQIYPMNLKYLMVEPASATHQKNAYRELIKRDLQGRYGILGIAYYFAVRPVLLNFINQIAPYLPAHSILAGYVKEK